MFFEFFLGQNSYKNNKRVKQKMFEAYKDIPSSRKKNKTYGKNPYIKKSPTRVNKVEKNNSDTLERPFSEVYDTNQ